MRETGLHSPGDAYVRDRLTAPAYLEAPAFLKHEQPQWGPPIFADDAATQPRTDTVARSAWLWTPYRWDPEELRVTVLRPGPRRATGRLPERCRPAVAALFRGTRPLIGRQSRRRVLAAALLAMLLALGVHLSTFGAELAPISTPTNEEAAQFAPSMKCDASTDRLLYVAALNECFPAEW
jgi:hypothetical protein